MKGKAYEQEHRLLLDIDALFDTRFGTLLMLDPEAAVLAVRNGYQIREMDDFERLTEGRITNEQFEKAYAARNIETLDKSIITGIPTQLIAHVQTLVERLIRGVNIKAISITINTYPYTLPGPRIQDMITGLGLLIREEVHISAKSVDMRRLAPSVFLKQYDGWCTYVFDDWFTMHSNELLFHPINGVTVILPRRHLKAPGEFDVQGDDAMNQLNKQELHSMVLEEFIHLEYLPIVDFCFFTPGSYASSSSSSSGASDSSASGSSTKSA